MCLSCRASLINGGESKETPGDVATKRFLLMEAEDPGIGQFGQLEKP
jgi:hypothetical protein